MNLSLLTKFFEWGRKDFKLLTVIVLGIIVVTFYNKIEGTNSEVKTDYKNCELNLRNKDMKIDTLKDIINVLVREKMIDSIKNNKK